MTLPTQVTLVEVGPRDGLQNEATPLTVQDKVNFIQALAETGLRYIEAGSFVSPKWVPQMAASGAVFGALQRREGVTYAALTPNLHGFEDALQARVDEVAIFAAATESFSQKNINCSISDSLKRFAPVMAAAHKANIPVRGYVSCVLGCPYEGAVKPDQVAQVAKELYTMGCREISLGDTIGTGTPTATRALIEAVAKHVPREHIAGHFHNTYGQALANIYASLLEGITVFDSSVAGLGGCPYAKGASGNVATEDVVYMLEGLGIDTGVDLAALIQVGQRISHRLRRQNASHVAQAMGAKKG